MLPRNFCHPGLVAKSGGFSSAGDDNKKQRYDGDKDDDADINNVTIMM